jgi:hypothetical protein
MSCGYAQNDKQGRLNTHVAWRFNSTAHNNDFLDPQERFRILGSSHGEVRQWANRYNGDRVWLVFRKDLQHDFMSRL